MLDQFDITVVLDDLSEIIRDEPKKPKTFEFKL